MENPQITQKELILGKLNSETARIGWKQLQRYFASGHTLIVDDSLNLIDVAYQFHKNNTKQVETWLNDEMVTQVSNEQARRWYNDDADLWACVVKPWVLIQQAE